MQAVRALSIVLQMQGMHTSANTRKMIEDSPWCPRSCPAAWTCPAAERTLVTCSGLPSAPTSQCQECKGSRTTHVERAPGRPRSPLPCGLRNEGGSQNSGKAFVVARTSSTTAKTFPVMHTAREAVRIPGLPPLHHGWWCHSSKIASETAAADSHCRFKHSSTWWQGSAAPGRRAAALQ